MTIASKYIKAGFAFWFRPDKILDSTGALVDNPYKGFTFLGVCSGVTPTFDSTSISLKDSRGGTLKTVAKQVTEITETYKGTFADFKKNNLLFVFGAGKINVNSRNAVDYTANGENFGTTWLRDQAIVLGSSSDIDFIGNFRLNETTVVVNFGANTSAVTSATLNTHYKLDSALAQVEILELPNGVIEGTHNLYVKYSAAAIASTDNTYFSIDPQSAGGSIDGRFRLEIGYNSNKERLIRTGKVSINTSSVNFTSDDYSNFEMEFTILNTDGTAGKLFNV